MIFGRKNNLRMKNLTRCLGAALSTRKTNAMWHIKPARLKSRASSEADGGSVGFLQPDLKPRRGQLAIGTVPVMVFKTGTSYDFVPAGGLTKLQRIANIKTKRMDSAGETSATSDLAKS